MANDLDQMAGIAAAADAGIPATATEPGQEGPPTGAPAATDYTQEARTGVDFFAALVVGYAPKAESIWTEDAKARTAAALAPVMAKYQVTMSTLPPEIGLLIVAGPLLWQSSRAVAAQMAQDKAGKKPAPRQVAAPADAGQAPGKPDESGQAPAPLVHPQMALYQR